MRRLASLIERTEAEYDWLEAKKQAGQLIDHAGLLQKSSREEDRAKTLAAIHLALGDLAELTEALGAKSTSARIVAAMMETERDAAEGGSEQIERTAPTEDERGREYEKAAEESAERLDASFKRVEKGLQEDMKWLHEIAPEVSADGRLDDIWARADIRYRGILAEPGGDPHGKHGAHLVVIPNAKNRA